MMKKHSILCLCAVSLAIPLFGADYVSSGFNAKISKSGVVEKVTYGGKEILNDCQIHGGYQLAPGEEKYDTRLIQAMDYKGVAKVVTDGDKMTVTTDSILGNSKIPQAAKYLATVTFTPNEITFRTKITLLVDMKGHSSMFARNFNIPAPLIAGRGVRWVEENGKEELRTVPLEYQKGFRIQGKEAAFSLPGYLMTVSMTENATIGFWDSRQWKAPVLSFSIGYKERGSSQVVTFPAGKTYEWEFKIRMDKD